MPHTPGPWLANDDGEDITGKDGGIVAQTWRGDNTEAEVQANARLIAAAPDLLAALSSMLEDYCTCRGMGGDVFNGQHEAGTLCGRAALAIDKAKGGS